MKLKDGDIIINPSEIIDSLSKEDKLEVLKHYMTCPDVINAVLDYICDEDEDGWWAGDSDRTRSGFLKRVEDCHLKNLGRGNWKSLDEACAKITKIRSEQHLYYMLYHHPESHNMTISEWLRVHNKDDKINEHCSKIADDEIESIVTALKSEIESIRLEGQ